MELSRNSENNRNTWRLSDELLPHLGLTFDLTVKRNTPAPQPKAPDITPEPTLEPEPQNSVPFLSKQEPTEEPLPEPLQEEDPQPELG